MKLNNMLIVTLPDFARHFSFVEFWEKRTQFVRDMHPQKVYYWNGELEAAYKIVAGWIAKGNDATAADLEEGRNALEKLVGRPITAKEMTFSGEAPNLLEPIIRIQTGKTLDLPAYKGTDANVSLRRHKIEAHGKKGTTAAISIGGRQEIQIAAGGFAYVAEVEGGGFVEFLSTHMQNSRYEVAAISQEGELECSLIVRDMHTAEQEEVHYVVSFALTDDGYVFVNNKGKLITMSKFVTGIKFLLAHDGKAFYVKGKGNDVAVLYADGTLKSTLCTEGEKNVISVRFDGNGKIIPMKR